MRKNIISICFAILAALTLTSCTNLLAEADKADTTFLKADSAVLVIGFTNGDSASSVTGNLTLPATNGAGTAISWASGNTDAISNSGVVTRLAFDTNVILTATLKNGESHECPSGSENYAFCHSRNQRAGYEGDSGNDHHGDRPVYRNGHLVRLSCGVRCINRLYGDHYSDGQNGLHHNRRGGKLLYRRRFVVLFSGGFLARRDGCIPGNGRRTPD